MKKLITCLHFIIIVLGLSSHLLMGQARMINGAVTTLDSIPLLNVTIQVKSTKQVFLSDSMGLFTVKCYADDKLKVTARTRHVKMDENIKFAKVNLIFKGGEKNKEYAIGYGHVTEEHKVNAFSSLDTDQQDFSAYSSMHELIVGSFPDVFINNGEIIIRGKSSFESSNAALIIIDGINSTESTLFEIHPFDVQSINILKGGSAAIYGSRGVNGVVLVETKTGK